MYNNQDEDNQDSGNNSLFSILEQIGNNLDQKYQSTMKILTDKTQENKHPAKSYENQKSEVKKSYREK